MKAVVQQIGARMDYAVPRALYDDGLLGCLVTDLYFDRAPMLRKLANYTAGFPKSHVSRDLWQGFMYRAVLSRAQSRFRVWPHLQSAEAIANRTCQIARETNADLVYGFDTAMLPSMDRLQQAGTMIVMEQCVAPRAQFIKAMAKLRDKLAALGENLDESGLDETLAYAAMAQSVETLEWQKADRIYCPSAFVASALRDEGVAEDKIRIVPYGVTLPNLDRPHDTVVSRRPRVAFAGAFSWRKGAVEFGRLAAKLKTRADFEALGKITIAEAVAARIAPDVTLQGHLTKRSFLERLTQTDIVVLPSYSEGSATVIYEAMALGLPCVVSDACGSVITDGKDGFVFAASDDAGLEKAVTALLDDADLRREMGARAAETAQKYTRESYGGRVVAALRSDFEDHTRKRHEQ